MNQERLSILLWWVSRWTNIQGYLLLRDRGYKTKQSRGFNARRINTIVLRKMMSYDIVLFILRLIINQGFHQQEALTNFTTIRSIILKTRCEKWSTKDKRLNVRKKIDCHQPEIKETWPRNFIVDYQMAKAIKRSQNHSQTKTHCKVLVSLKRKALLTNRVKSWFIRDWLKILIGLYLKKTSLLKTVILSILQI